jgi:hypothetical protein
MDACEFGPWDVVLGLAQGVGEVEGEYGALVQQVHVGVDGEKVAPRSV